jgi:hypothetical protein
MSPPADPHDAVALVFALTAALVVLVGTIGVVLRETDAEPVFEVAGLMVAGTLGYLSARRPRD